MAEMNPPEDELLTEEKQLQYLKNVRMQALVTPVLSFYSTPKNSLKRDYYVSEAKKKYKSKAFSYLLYLTMRELAFLL